MPHTWVDLCVIWRDIGVAEVESCNLDLVQDSLLLTSSISRRFPAHESTPCNLDSIQTQRDIGVEHMTCWSNWCDLEPQFLNLCIQIQIVLLSRLSVWLSALSVQLCRKSVWLCNHLSSYLDNPPCFLDYLPGCLNYLSSYVHYLPIASKLSALLSVLVLNSASCAPHQGMFKEYLFFVSINI